MQSRQYMGKRKSLTLPNPLVSVGACQVILKDGLWARETISKGIRASLWVNRVGFCEIRPQEQKDNRCQSLHYPSYSSEAQNDKMNTKVAQIFNYC